MTPEPPPRPARRTRPDSDFRKRALGLDAPAPGAAPAGEAAPGEAPPTVVRRESLRQALARIPDLDRDATEAPDVGASPAGASAAPASAVPLAPSVPETPDPAPGPVVPDQAAPAALAPSAPVGRSIASPEREAAVAAVVAASDPPSSAVAEPGPPSPLVDGGAARGAEPPAYARSGGGGRRHIAPPPRPPWWRRMAFGLAIVVLVGSIPLLGRTGYRLVTESTAGKDGKSAAGREDPGYEELVTSTPTALVVQKDAVGLPVALTFLSLSSGAAGGSVIFVPLDTAVVEPGFGVDRLRTSYTAVADDPVGATNQIAAQTAKVLNVGIDEVIVLDDRGWSQLVAPVAPIPLDNPEPLDLPSGPLPSGQVSLAADQVGPYLAARRDGEDELAALYRQEVLWTAWLDAVAKSDRPDAVPGESSTGMGLFARTLSAGAVSYDTLPGAFSTPTDGGLPLFVPDTAAVNDLVVDAVPAPDSPYPGARTTVRVLNGVGPGDIPTDVIRQVVALNGSVTVVGNGPQFDTEETTIVYSDPARKDYALLLKASLGATGEVRLDREASDAVDITVVLGRDILGDTPQTRASSSTTTITTTTTTEPLGGM